MLQACQFDTKPAAQTFDCKQTSSYRAVPNRLSQSCLYADITVFKVSPQLRKFTPNYQLWSDGAVKSRWIYLPEGSQINNENPDRWIFPVGTQIFKEFRKVLKNNQEIKVETRHLQKITPGKGVDSWLVSTYMWNRAQTDATYLATGAVNVFNTGHKIPSEQECVDCHQGNTDFILGFEALQLSDAQAKNAFGHGPKQTLDDMTLKELIKQRKLTHFMSLPVLPGNKLTQQALGYLHANCGNCHNPLGYAAEQEAEHLKLRHKVTYTRLRDTDVYQTAVNQKTKNFTAVPYIFLGAQDDELAIFQSAAYIRMNSTDENYRMPLIGREKVDYQGVELMHQWLLTIPTPEEFESTKSQKRQTASNIIHKPINEVLTGKGLQIAVQFYKDQNIVPVMAVYWPQDKSLKNNPVMDHKNGYFSDKLIVGNKGDTLSLRNSDEVGHTIYVKDKKNSVNWQLNYMPPDSEFEQALFWDNDVFVELKCRLHLYMSSWVGSISSKYHITSLFEESESYKRLSMNNYPEHFSVLKIWLPKFKLIETTINIGDEQRFDLIKGDEIQGQIRIKRVAQ